MPDREPFPFIVGCGRSGTTLLRAMLDAHSDVAVPYESYFPVWFGRRRERYETAHGFAAERFLDDLLAHESFRRWGLANLDVRTALTEAHPDSYPDAIRACYALYARTRAKPRYADKTPAFVSHIPLLATMFPESVFVHIVRDGHAVVLSRAEAAWGSDRIDFEALLWRSQVRKGRADGAALGPDRYHEILYEDLVDDPERIAKELCRFVDIDFDPRMLEYHHRATRILDEQPFPDEHRNLLRPPTKGLRDWKAELKPDDLALFEELAGDALDAFGYERSIAVPRATMKARAMRSRFRFHSIVQYRRARSAAWRALHRGSAR
jgi:hypothetical protein